MIFMIYFEIFVSFYLDCNLFCLLYSYAWHMWLLHLILAYDGKGSLDVSLALWEVLVLIIPSEHLWVGFAGIL